jgi:hypothetical protein
MLCLHHTVRGPNGDGVGQPKILRTSTQFGGKLREVPLVSIDGHETDDVESSPEQSVIAARRPDSFTRPDYARDDLGKHT